MLSKVRLVLLIINYVYIATYQRTKCALIMCMSTTLSYFKTVDVCNDFVVCRILTHCQQRLMHILFCWFPTLFSHIYRISFPCNIQLTHDMTFYARSSTSQDELLYCFKSQSMIKYVPILE